MTDKRGTEQDAGMAPSLGDVETMARRAFASLPDVFRDACSELAIRVVDFPDPDMLRDMGLNDPFELTGLYDGSASPFGPGDDQPQAPDIVWLFRRPILEEWIDRGDVDLERLVRHVLVHELAHHLGWSDEDIMAVDDWTK